MRRLRTGWGAELLIMFSCGFLLATMLWVGLWFFWTRPAQAATLRAKETALQANEAALLDCVAAKDQCNELKAKSDGENKALDAKLNEALIGWGRCIKSKNTPYAQEEAKPNTP